MKSNEGSASIAAKIADVIYQGCPVRGIAPSYENPQWRFLQGRGELYSNTEAGGAFNLFEAAEFPDKSYPLYVHDKPHTRKEITLKVARSLDYGSHDELRLTTGQRERMIKLCNEYGYYIESPNFDPAIYG